MCGSDVSGSGSDLDIVFPGDRPSLEVQEIAKPQFLKPADDLPALDPDPAEHDHLAVPRDLGDSAPDLAPGNAQGSLERNRFGLTGFPDFQDEWLLPGLEPPFELTNADGADRAGAPRNGPGPRSRRRIPADFFIIDGRSDGGPGTARWTSRILGYFNQIEGRIERVVEEEAINQGRAQTKDDLNGFDRLKSSNYSRDDAEDA